MIKQAYLSIKNAFSAFFINFYLFKVNSKILQDGSGKKVISFCLYGNSQKYFSNIAACINSYQQKFEGWIIRIYVSYDLPENTLDFFKKHNCELVIMSSTGVDHRYTLWRFLVLDDVNVDCVLIRDIDSIASDREKIMVDRWISSGKKIHIIRDHPSHIALIMAGLWGVKTRGKKQHVKEIMLNFKKLDQFGVDQEFLEMIYYKTFPDLYVNDIYNRFANESVDIIPHNALNFFIGEINSAHPDKERHLKELVDFYKSQNHVA